MVEMRITDAWGRDVRELTQCSRCLQMIKDVYWHKGKPYGCECIKTVTGFRTKDWVVTEHKGRKEIDAIATRNRNWDSIIHQFIYSPVENFRQFIRDWDAAIVCDSNRAIFPSLPAILKSKVNSGFCAGIHYELFEVGQKHIGDLPPRALNILADIYAKGHGRRGSKAYNDAEDMFWQKF